MARSGTQRLLVSAGRAALSGVFITGGWAAARDPGPRVAQAAGLGLPDPDLAVRANGLAMVAGGVALALGVVPRVAAAGLVASLAPTTLAGHRFWEETDPARRSQQRTQFMKNLGLIGGLLVVVSQRSQA